ncbi:hypothetical protein OIU85_015271 [Salix viminalis]|uniref:J domain-containing protein n=3 Tax=Salix TaxID=40685 RepID=A0A9Q0NKP4_SALVM|nr:hypothetical protein OIU85_015271 [Salix viminalis]
MDRGKPREQNPEDYSEIYRILNPADQNFHSLAENMVCPALMRWSGGPIHKNNHPEINLPRFVSTRSIFYFTRQDTKGGIDSMATTSSFYEVLGLPRSATGHEIKAAYRKLARTCHPDVVSMNQKEMSAREFIQIHAAYSTLSDPDKRENYDRDLYRNRRPFGSSSMRSATMAAASGYTSRKWETDQCW